jgi:hypothetical protein
MPVTLGNFKTQFARGRLSLVKNIKSFHQKQARLVGEMEEEHWVSPEVMVIISCPKGGTCTYASPGLEVNPEFIRARDCLDAIAQHVMELKRLAVKLEVQAGRKPEVPVGWGRGRGRVMCL